MDSLSTPPISTPPILIARSSSSSLPDALSRLLHLRLEADNLLNSALLESELAEGTRGPQGSLVCSKLAETIQAAAEFLAAKDTGRKLTSEEEARGTFVGAWALGRIGEYDGTTPEDLPAKLEAALKSYQAAADLLRIPPPPPLDAVPSVTRPQPNKPPLVLPEARAWVGEMLAEWARTQTTLAFARLLLYDVVIDEEKLADLLDLSCRRNVQALFTPLDPLSPVDDTVSASEAGTVMGNAHLIKDISSMFPFASSSSLWTRRINWATHVADTRFVEASMSANRLVDAASASASILQSASTSPVTRNEVRGVLEATVRRLVPFEKTQGSCLLGLGRVMLEAVGALYLGRDEGKAKERRRRDASRDSQVEEEETVVVPENELVRETRQVLIRAAGLFENAYASFRRSPPTSRTSRDEQRLLQRLETTYCFLEELDNEEPEVVELRAQRVERALWINDRLMALGDDEIVEDSSGDEDVDSDEEDLAEGYGRLEI